MGKLIFVAGKSGRGKTTSLRNLDPKRSIIINADANELPFENSTKNFNKENKNYVITSKMPLIKTVLLGTNDRPEVNVAVIDTWSRIMTDAINDPIFRNAADGRKAWGEMAAQQYDLFNLIRHDTRPDLNVYLFSHIESEYNDMGLLEERVTTQGKQLDKFKPESFSNIVLYAEAKKIQGNPKMQYFFRTVTTGYDTCKTPIGMFKEELIDNDLAIVNETINKYYER